MIDLPWLMEECPTLVNVPSLTVISTEDQGVIAQGSDRRGDRPTHVHRPSLPLQWGTHHTKAALLEYEGALRVCVHSANYVYCNWHAKNQGIFVQDFPARNVGDSSPDADAFGSEFHLYLQRYLGHCGGVDCRFLDRYDFSAASVALVGSVPGYHKGAEASQWGHLRLRKLLAQHAEVPLEWRGRGGVLAQFSSLGSLQPRWLEDFTHTLSTSTAGVDTRLQPALAVPSVEQVRGGLEGWAAGCSVPIRRENLQRPFLDGLWRRWGFAPAEGGALAARAAEAMPHIKTYCRYGPADADGRSTMAWLYCGSHNLSKAAWGEAQRGGSQLCVRSYELGVVYFPRRLELLEADPRRGGFFLRRRPQPTGPAAAGGPAAPVLCPRRWRYPTALPPAPACGAVWAVNHTDYLGLDRHGQPGPTGVGVRYYGNGRCRPDPPSAAEEFRQGRRRLLATDAAGAAHAASAGPGSGGLHAGVVELLDSDDEAAEAAEDDELRQAVAVSLSEAHAGAALGAREDEELRLAVALSLAGAAGAAAPAALMAPLPLEVGASPQAGAAAAAPAPGSGSGGTRPGHRSFAEVVAALEGYPSRAPRDPPGGAVAHDGRPSTFKTFHALCRLTISTRIAAPTTITRVPKPKHPDKLSVPALDVHAATTDATAILDMSAENHIGTTSVDAIEDRNLRALGRIACSQTCWPQWRR
ncbi:unnamed protein product [Prorocentrum cordatum]|uniref:Tyrosyl-DNA phosphodiesterase 1 n=1 Tax=Prorocentrum cordatum TaxID=2364126 RepID=A0ABN9R0C8_9DINO|nr:unnamed protein product [Polarella glacialis]